MVNVSVYDYRTSNKIQDDVELKDIPRVGEYIIMKEGAPQDDYSKYFYIVRGVSYAIGGWVGIHVEPIDLEKAKKQEEQLEELMKKLRKEQI